MKKSYTISIPAATFWKIYVPAALVVVALGMLAGMLVIDKVVMPGIVGVNRDMVDVPSVIGMPLNDAREALYKVGLLTEIKGREYDNKIAEESVLQQFPAAKAHVKKGRRIAVTLSKGKEIATIPDVRNISERQARIELKKHGFTVGKIKKVYSEDKAVDVVLDAFPQSGTTVSRAMEIDLMVSKGRRPTHAEVPNVVGESLTEARKKFEEAGLKAGNIDYQNNPSLLPGTVISQSASPGSNVPLESSIDIVVSVVR